MLLMIDTSTGDVIDAFLSAAAAAEETKAFEELVLEVLREASAEQFATGAGWPRSDKVGQTLVKSGDLRDSLTRAGGDSRVRITEDTITLQSQVPYARYLAAGARGMPRRDPARIDTWRTGERVAQRLDEFITRGFR